MVERWYRKPKFCVSPTAVVVHTSVFESELPIFLIETLSNQQIVNEPKVDANLRVISNPNGQINSVFDSATDYDGRIGIEIRGASSQMFPKNNYSFETRNDDGTNNNVTILGLPKENDWVLHGPFSDKSLLRNVVAYHAGTATGQYTPRTRLCEVFLNNDYRGVYVFTEKLKRDNDRVDIERLEPTDIMGDALTGGYLFQIDRDDESTEDDGWWSNSSPISFMHFMIQAATN